MPDPSIDPADLVLDDSGEFFSGAVEWLGERALAHLDVDEPTTEGAETCEAALAHLRAYVADAEAADARWRGRAASCLPDPADAPRLRLSELEVAADGSATPYYDGDGLLDGHVVLVEVAPDGSLGRAYVAG